MTVPPRVSLVTLGVADLGRATAFYEALGWSLSSASVPGDVSFFGTDGGLLALWGIESLAADAGFEPPDPARFRGIALAINMESPEAVDGALSQVEQAGGRVIKPGHRADWGGYTGYFADPDGHLWEVAFNPGWPIGPDGRPTLPS